jgi:type IV pilus assembly protein PilV
VEVLVSMTLLAIGAAGVIAMQKAAVQGDHDARQLDMANSIAREWMERLRRDTMLWTPADVAGQVPPPNLQNAALVQTGGGGGQGAVWYLPIARLAPNGAQADVESPGFDILGRDLPLASLTIAQQGGGAGDWTTGLMFCTSVRITPLTVDQELLRAEVRVFWPRQMYTAMNQSDCTQNPPASWDLQPPTDQYHFLYLTSAIRQNVAPQ